MTDGGQSGGSSAGQRPTLGPLNDSGSPAGMLDRKELATLVSVLAPLPEPRRDPAGRVLWSQGERSGGLAVIHRERVKVTWARADGTAMQPGGSDTSVIALRRARPGWKRETIRCGRRSSRVC